MKRGGGFKQPERPRVKPVLVPRAEPARAVLRRVDGNARMTVAIPKPRTAQHLEYMRVVRLLPCAHCNRIGPSQFCHSDEGKGTGIKSDCRYGWPGCGPHSDSPGCHYLIGTQRIYPKQERRELEAKLARETRHLIKDMGQWPDSLEWID